jgi:hypothetical protein
VRNRLRHRQLLPAFKCRGDAVVLPSHLKNDLSPYDLAEPNQADRTSQGRLADSDNLAAKPLLSSNYAIELHKSVVRITVSRDKQIRLHDVQVLSNAPENRCACNEIETVPVSQSAHNGQK